MIIRVSVLGRMGHALAAPVMAPVLVSIWLLVSRVVVLVRVVLVQALRALMLLPVLIRMASVLVLSVPVPGRTVMVLVPVSIWLLVSRVVVLVSIVPGLVSHALIWLRVLILMVIVLGLFVPVWVLTATAQALVSILRRARRGAARVSTVLVQAFHAQLPLRGG